MRVDARAVGWFRTRARTRRAITTLLGGPPRRAGEPLSQREADLAASVQQLVEASVLDAARHAHRVTGERRLCLAGGVALNCVANGRLAREGPFEELWVQPAAGDAGGAVGAALAYWHLELGHPRTADGLTDAMSGAFLGPDLDDGEVRATLAERGLPHRVITDPRERARVVADRLAGGDVVAWCRGPMEFGPRALGHRSLLADPRSPTVRRRLNETVKGREDFRPFAPAVLAERAGEWFEMEGRSPYMLVVAPVRDEHRTTVEVEPTSFSDRADVPRSSIPACTHVDGSARIQTVEAGTNPELHELLAAFDERTGCPVLVNTSFNRAGEPIVATPAQAVDTATAAQVDLLVVGDALVEGEDLAEHAVPPDRDPGDAGGAPRRPTAATAVAAIGFAAVPLALQLHHLKFRYPVLHGAVAVVAAWIVAGRARRGWAVAAVAAVAAWWLTRGNARDVAEVGGPALAAAFLASTALGTDRHRRTLGANEFPGRGAPLVAGATLVVVNLLFLTRTGFRVPAALLAVGSVATIGLRLLDQRRGPRRAVDELPRAIAPAWAVGVARRVGRAGSVLARSVTRAFAALGRAIGAVVLAVVFVPAVLLPWAVQRLVGWDPLWAPRPSGSRWVRRHGSDELRPAELWFADPAPSHLVRRRAGFVLARTVVGLCLLVGATAGSMALHAFLTQPAAPAAVSVPDVVAEPWEDELAAAMDEMNAATTVSSYVGTELGDVASEHLNVRDGVRRSWTPPADSCVEPIEVWMFGGSTTFGWKQRDGHTLASELARLAWSHGTALHVRNFGVPGDVGWQEARRLERELARTDRRPALVILYDGFNDVRAQQWAWEAGRGGPGTYVGFFDQSLMPLLPKLREQEVAGHDRYVVEPPPTRVRPLDRATVAAAAADQLAFAHEAVGGRLRPERVSFLHVFHPVLATRAEAVAGDFPQDGEQRALFAEVRAALPEGMVDLSGIFDERGDWYYRDDVHTTEAANVVVAEALWGEVRGLLPAGTSGSEACR